MREHEGRHSIGARLLLISGVATAAASLLHVAIIFGGPDWYRFFGAGERMARLAGRGALSPTLITLTIAGILALWALYGLSGARVIRRLPLLPAALSLIGTVFLARGIFGIPVVVLVDHPYLNELRGRMTFMFVSSAICIALGLCFLIGARMSGYRLMSARA
jgi:putative oxidoreductase